MPIVTEKPAAGEKTRSKLIPHDEEVVLTIIESKIEEDQYADPEADGSQPEKLVITWSLEPEDITRKQQRKGVEAGKRIWQRLGLFYYVKDDGLPTMFKAVIDSLQGRINGDGIMFEFDGERFYEEPDILVGIKAPCRVEQYAKKKGANKGQLDNRIGAVRPLDDDDEDEGADTPPTPQPARPAPRNQPQRATSQNTQPAPRQAVPATRKADPLFEGEADDDIPF